ncbi:MAG: M15 family metallopeptidase [Lachnospiraceae bacterium]|nr:M15 family metallopeptidase [Lachnospiraceae bacterium]
MNTVEVKADVTGTRIYAADDKDFYIEEISQDLLNSMKGRSYAADIDESIVNATMLRHVVIKYVDFNGKTQTGELVCNEKIAVDMLEIFEELYKAGYRLEKVKLIDEYNADDDASMEDNNTSCFNYRVVDGTDKLSYHAYGLAIDVNPFYNPYVIYHTDKEDYICPTQSAPYAYRDKEFAYKIDENDLAYKLFKAHGFIWGGDWNSCKDYQHFEKRVK